MQALKSVCPDFIQSKAGNSFSTPSHSTCRSPRRHRRHPERPRLILCIDSLCWPPFCRGTVICSPRIAKSTPLGRRSRPTRSPLANTVHFEPEDRHCAARYGLVTSVWWLTAARRSMHWLTAQCSARGLVGRGMRGGFTHWSELFRCFMFCTSFLVFPPEVDMGAFWRRLLGVERRLERHRRIVADLTAQLRAAQQSLAQLRGNV